MTKEEIVKHLEYIANSPSEANGGFNEQAIYVAKQTIQHIESKESELTSAKDEIDRLASRCDTYYAKLEEQQKEIELKRETIQKYEQTVSLFLDDKESLTKQLDETKEKAREFATVLSNWIPKQYKGYKEAQQFLNQTKGGD